jgi:hypothetical protein
MRFLRSVIVQDVTPAADGTLSYDLPVNPVSHLIFTIKCLNVTDEATIAQILALVTNVEVLHRGTSIVQMSAADLYALNFALLGNAPLALNMIATDNATRALSLIIPLARKLFDPTEGFPDSKAGELQLQATVDIATSDADGLILQVEAVEMLDAHPSRYLKSTTLTKTPAATGDCDLDLPIAHTLAGVILYSTTIPATTAWTTTIDRVKLLADNTERYYSNTNWESLHSDLINRCGDRPGHTTARGDDSIAHYALIDFCPGNRDDYLFDTKPLSALKLRITAGDTNVLRAIPLELVSGR